MRTRSAKNFIVIETTYPNLHQAKNLAKILLEEKLAACVHFSKIKSTFFWERKIQNENEILVVIKTKNSLYNAVEKVIAKHHPYKIPQIISMAIKFGSEPYLDWINSETK